MKLLAELQQIEGVINRSVMCMCIVMWFVVRKPTTGEIIAISTDQIVLPGTKMCTTFTSFPFGGLKGDLSMRLGYFIAPLLFVFL